VLDVYDAIAKLILYSEN